MNPTDLIILTAAITIFAAAILTSLAVIHTLNLAAERIQTITTAALTNQPATTDEQWEQLIAHYHDEH